MVAWGDEEHVERTRALYARKRTLLLGLFDGEGTLHHVGVAASFAAPLRRSLLADVRGRAELPPGAGARGWGHLAPAWVAAAIVTREGAQYGMARVTAAIAERRGTPVRVFTELDEEPGEPPVVILGHTLWKARFASDPASRRAL